MFELKALFIIALLLLIVLLLLQSRLRVLFSYAETGALVKVKIGPFRYTLYPLPAKKIQKPKKEKPNKKRNKKKDLEKATSTHKLSRSLLNECLNLAMDLTGRFKNKLWIEEFLVQIRWGLKDPAKAAISYGYCNAVLAFLVGLLEANFTMLKRQTNIVLDYTLEKPTVSCRISCSMTLWQGLSLGLYGGLRAFRFYRSHKKQTTATERANTNEKAVKIYGKESSN